jgi:hypothetical protein
MGADGYSNINKIEFKTIHWAITVPALEVFVIKRSAGFNVHV